MLLRQGQRDQRAICKIIWVLGGWWRGSEGLFVFLTELEYLESREAGRF